MLISETASRSEVATQVAAQVIGNDATVAFAGTQGTLELNAYLPVIATNLLDSARLVGRAAADFAQHCVDGIEANEARCRAYAESSPAIATALNLLIGYDAATGIVQTAMREDRSVRSVLADSGLVDPAAIDAILDIDAMAASAPKIPQNSTRNWYSLGARKHESTKRSR